jgi:hypothetical protein
VDANVKTLLALILGVLICTGTFAETSTGIRALLAGSQFHALPLVADIPPQVLRLCIGHDEQMAERDGAWNATDVVGGLPRARLIWAVTDGATYVIHFEQGGRGHSDIIVVASSQGPKASQLLWRHSGHRFSDFAFLVASLDALETDAPRPSDSMPAADARIRTAPCSLTRNVFALVV